MLEVMSFEIPAESVETVTNHPAPRVNDERLTLSCISLCALQINRTLIVRAHGYQ